MSALGYEGSWWDIAVRDEWEWIEIPDYEIEAARKSNRYYPEHVAGVRIAQEEGIPYGSYLTMGNKLYYTRDESGGQ